ncbi:MAG: glycosyltransferase 87 family protein [Acidimicrobiales bacterium]
MSAFGGRFAGAVDLLRQPVRGAPGAGGAPEPRVPRWSPELGDALLYAGAALFAGVTAAVSTISLYRVWGWIALGPYLAAAIASLLVWRHRRVRSPSGGTPALPATPELPELAGSPGSASPPGTPGTPGTAGTSGRRRLGGARIWILAGVLVGATLVPLGVEVSLRGNGPTAASAHVQPEVVVIDQAGTRLARGQDPYHAQVRGGHLVSAVPGEPAYESFFPYLPLMTLFGLPSSTRQPVQVTDARIFFSLVTLVVAGAALILSSSPRRRRMRAAQVLVVLPTAALPLATGGDDMPVVALLLLAIVLAQRRRPGWSGLVLGVVSAMKFTAWPLAALALFCARDRHGRRAPLWMLAGMAVVAVPVIVPFATTNPAAFLSNVVLFPLGLSGVASPATSNLPGHLLTTAFPWMHTALPLVVGLAGLALLGRRLVRRPPATTSTVAYLAGWVMLVALSFAPATRVGYLLYPFNFFVWGWMTSEKRRPAEEAEGARAAEGAGGEDGERARTLDPILTA